MNRCIHGHHHATAQMAALCRVELTPGERELKRILEAEHRLALARLRDRCAAESEGATRERILRLPLIP